MAVCVTRDVSDVGMWLDTATIYGIARTSPLRTVIDSAELLDTLSLEIMIEDGLRRSLFTPRQLQWRASARCGPGVSGSARVTELLRRHGLGKTDSGWEVRVAEVLTAAGLPEPVRQLPVLTIDGKRFVDLAYPGPPVIVFEYDSDQWHSGVTRRHRDPARRNVLRLAGCTVIEVTSALAADPDRLVQVATAALGAVVYPRGT